MRWQRAALLASVAPLLLGLGACQGGDVPSDPVDPDAGRDELVRQRADVLDLTERLVAGTAIAIGGVAPDDLAGTYRGCSSVFPEGFRDYRYAVRVRVDAGAVVDDPTASLLDLVAPVLAEAGVEATPGEGPGERRDLGGESPAGVGVSVAEYPSLGRYLLLDLSGPCVEVPEEQREAWLGRDEPPG